MRSKPPKVSIYVRNTSVSKVLSLDLGIGLRSRTGTMVSGPRFSTVLKALKSLILKQNPITFDLDMTKNVKISFYHATSECECSNRRSIKCRFLFTEWDLKYAEEECSSTFNHCMVNTDSKPNKKSYIVSK